MAPRLLRPGPGQRLQRPDVPVAHRGPLFLPDRDLDTGQCPDAVRDAQRLDDRPVVGDVTVVRGHEGLEPAGQEAPHPLAQRHEAVHAGGAVHVKVDRHCPGKGDLAPDDEAMRRFAGRRHDPLVDAVQRPATGDGAVPSLRKKHLGPAPPGQHEGTRRRPGHRPQDAVVERREVDGLGIVQRQHDDPRGGVVVTRGVPLVRHEERHEASPGPESEAPHDPERIAGRRAHLRLQDVVPLLQVGSLQHPEGAAMRRLLGGHLRVGRCFPEGFEVIGRPAGQGVMGAARPGLVEESQWTEESGPVPAVDPDAQAVRVDAERQGKHRHQAGPLPDLPFHREDPLHARRSGRAGGRVTALRGRCGIGGFTARPWTAPRRQRGESHTQEQAEAREPACRRPVR